MKLVAATVLAVGILAALPGAAPANKVEQGTIQSGVAPSAAVGEDIKYQVYLPHGYAGSDRRYPVLYLLHGRGDTMQAWTAVKSDLDGLIARKAVPPVIAVMPDAPWQERANYYVDSLHRDGKAVETGFTRDLVSHVDGAFRTAAHRGGRLIGGYSMGGAGAVGYALRHQNIFGHALVLSPAVYTPLPPADSSAREFGAYGNGDSLFDEEVYRRLNYPAVLPGLDPALPVRMFVAVGDDEWAGPEPSHDLDFEAAKLYNAMRRKAAVEFRVLNGGHDWSVWRAGFIEGLTHLGRTLSVEPPMGLPQPLYGTPGTDRAGGVAAHPNGSITLAVNNQVIRKGGWTTTLDVTRLYGVVPMPDGGVITAGYVRGSRPADDMVIARLSASGQVLWLKTFGDPARADRIYALARAADGVYVAGYTSGSQAGPSLGDKDAILAFIDGDGERTWVRQFGGPGEDKAFAVAAGPEGVFVAGTFGLTRFGADGTRDWTQPGTFFGAAIDSSGRVVATGPDLTVASYISAGKPAWKTELGVGTGAEVVALPSGEVAVVGFSDGLYTVPAGGLDIVVFRLDKRGNRVAVQQFGSPFADGADSFREENLYAAYGAGRLHITGLTADSDVFLASLELA